MPLDLNSLGGHHVWKLAGLKYCAFVIDKISECCPPASVSSK